MLGLIFFVLGGAIGIIGRLLSRNAAPDEDPQMIVDASPAMRLIYRLHIRH